MPTLPLARTRADAIRSIADRLEARKERVVGDMVRRYGEEIVDYRTAGEDFLLHDVYRVSLENLEALLRTLVRGEPPADDEFARTRAGAARRVRQGVPLESFLHAARLWGQTTWETVLELADPDEPAEREAALHIAGLVQHHVDLMSTVVAASFLAEAEGVSRDREVVRRDLLDALIAGRGEEERIRRLARSLRLRDAYVVVLLRAERSSCEDVALRGLVEAAREHLRPAAGSLLVGMRHGEVVALYPAAPDEADAVRTQATALAGALAGADVAVGLSGRHPGIASIAIGYDEAVEAVEIAVGTGARGRAVVFDDVLIDHLVRCSPHGDRVLDGTLRPLLEYDAERQAELVPTLRAYVDAGFNLTRAAEKLCVHANTVVYRLRRIKELSGRDPHDPNDLLLLFLGLKLSELSSRA